MLVILQLKYVIGQSQWPLFCMRTVPIVVQEEEASVMTVHLRLPLCVHRTCHAKARV